MSNITLPPSPIAPELSCLYDKAGGKGTTKTLNRLLEQYAIAAVELDRQGRGEPVAGVEITALIADMAAFLEASGDPYADPLIKHAREVLSAAQPAEPVKEGQGAIEPTSEVKSAPFFESFRRNKGMPGGDV